MPEQKGKDANRTGAKNDDPQAKNQGKQQAGATGKKNEPNKKGR